MAAERIKEAMASSVETEGYFVEVIALVQSIPRANLYSVAIGVSAFLIVRLLKRYAPKIPGALVALALLTVIVAVFDLAAKGVGVLGAMPSGPPTLTLPAIPATDYLRLLPSALAIVAILLCEGLLVVRSYSSKYGYKADGDQMLFAYGAANIAAGFTGSLLTGNSPSRSAAMDASGAKSQLPSLVAAGTIAVVMLFFTDVLAFLPNAALAGIVANAVLSLIEVHELRELLRMRRSDFWIAATCLVSVLALGPLRAVAIAFLLSLVDVIRRASRPETSALEEAPDGSHFVPVEGQASGSSGLVVYRFGAPLYFANATLFLDEIEQLLARARSPVRWFVLDAEAMVDVDTTGAQVLRQAITLLAARGVTFAVSRADRSFRSWLERYDLMERIDPSRFYPTNRHAAAAFREDQAKAVKKEGM
jgi:MFS superfamily sulfate permease-like transporter